MIKSWILENFKSVHKKRSLNFKPLTLFVGANSTGKSTVIQSILLNIQTLQNNDYPREIILNGHIVKLGSYDDVLSNLAQTGEITFGFVLEPSLEAKKEIPRYNEAIWILDESENLCDLIECSFSFTAYGETSEKEMLQLHPKLGEFKLKTWYKDEDDKKSSEEVWISKSKNSIEERIKYYKLVGNVPEKNSLNFEVNKPKKLKEQENRFIMPRRNPESSVIAGAKFKHFLLNNFSVVYDEVEELCIEVMIYLNGIDHFYYRSLSRNSTVINEIEKNNNLQRVLKTIFEEVLSEFKASNPSQLLTNKVNTAFEHLVLSFTVENLNKAVSSFPASYKRSFLSRVSDKETTILNEIRRNKESIYRLRVAEIPNISYKAIDYIRLFFTKGVKYLGPLRDEPKPIYPIGSPTNLKDIGFKGEFSAAVLDMYKSETIEYVKSDFMNDKKLNPLISKDTLLNAVTDWLIYMGIAKSVETEEKGKLGHEIKVKTTEKEDSHDLTNVGVGVSQVLPILLLSLLSEKGSTLIFEQPELHLHPKVQTRLADFFVSMTLMGKQCIVETHSEYLINQLRYLVAISKEDEISNNTVIFFVEKGDGSSEYREIKVNKYGVIEDWPIGFFDENEKISSETLRASIIKSKIKI